MPEVSVIVPVYNVARYLSKCVDSILAQSFSDFDLILIDDGSTDTSGEICDAYARRYPERIAVVHQRNTGLSGARNSGFPLARGRYILFVDSDDYIQPDMLETLYRTAMKFDCADMVFCGAGLVDENGRELGAYLNSLPEQIPLDPHKDRELFFAHHASWCRLVKREIYLDNGLLFPVGLLYEDMSMTNKLLLHIRTAVYVHRPLYRYLIRQGSIMTTRDPERTVDSLIRVMGDLVDYYREQGAWETFREEIEAVAAYHILYHASMRLAAAEPRHPLLDTVRAYMESTFPDYRENRYLKGWTKSRRYVLGLIEKRRYRQLALMLRLKAMAGRSAEAGGKAPVKNMRGKSRSAQIIKKITPAWTHPPLKAFRRFLWDLRDTVKGLPLGRVYKSRRGGRNFYLIGTPVHANLGDQAIALAEIKFLSEHIPPGSALYEIPLPDFYMHRSAMRRYLNKEDVLLITGGGYMGMQYFDGELLVRRTIAAFPRHRVIVLPQTVFYGDGREAQKELARSVTLYARHPDLHIFAREKISFEMMRRHYPRNNVYLIPDSVLLLNFARPRLPRSGILLCLRDDVEKKLSNSHTEAIAEAARQIDGDVRFTDTFLMERLRTGISAAEREALVVGKFDEFKRARLVVTDRLHGMVFCAVTGTPCIALDNYNHKVRGIYDWIEQLRYIRFLPSADLFPETARELLRSGPGDYDNTEIVSRYRLLLGLLGL